MDEPMSIAALSGSRPIVEFLRSQDRQGSVAAVFSRSCIVRLGSDSLVGLVLPELGNGPLNVVVQATRGAFDPLRPGVRVVSGANLLTLGALRVSLSSATLWEPSPAWNRLRSRRAAVTVYSRKLASMVKRLAPPDSLAQLLGEPELANGPSAAAHTVATAERAARALRDAWARDDAAGIQAASAQLAGLGVGLTPAGDDFLVGTMTWAWLVHPRPEWLCGLVLEAAAAKTTFLSAAFLEAASRGECSAAWHDFLEAAEAQHEQRIEAAVRQVMTYGHTSGADALAGFLWMAS